MHYRFCKADLPQNRGAELTVVIQILTILYYVLVVRGTQLSRPRSFAVTYC